MGGIVIGRNEGDRLARCLSSISGSTDLLVYVDSCSIDDSVSVANAAGIFLVQLDTTMPITAARARNAGFEALRKIDSPEFVQLIDGDCELQPGWIAIARQFLESHSKVAIVCGRRRERAPETSIYNRLCDREWNTPIGLTQSCGGDAMVRMAAIDEVGGFAPLLIAGEEPELCVRLRQKSWEIWRLDAEMTLHDAAMTQFIQWWRRARRGGHAAAEGMALHGATPERLGVAAVRRALFWGLALPVTTVLLTALTTPVWLALLVAYPAQVVRLAVRDGGSRNAWEEAVFLTIGKFAELIGVLEYGWGRLLRRPRRLIEYK